MPVKTAFSTIDSSPTLHQAVIKSLALKVIEHSTESESLVFPNEAELCQQLGVSRSVLREAVKVLAAKRMVEVRPKSGTRARPRNDWNLLDPDLLAWQCEAKPHAKFLEDLYEMRMGIEPLACELAAARATPEEITLLGQHLNAMERALDDPPVFVESDIEFHHTIYQASRNDLLQHLATIIRRAFGISFSYTTSLPRPHVTSFPAHRDVFEAIKGRNPRAARLASELLVKLASEELRMVIDHERTR